MKHTPPPKPRMHYCVLDREMRLLYLGTDQAEAQKVMQPGFAFGSSQLIGDAMKAAAAEAGKNLRTAKAAYEDSKRRR